MLSSTSNILDQTQARVNELERELASKLGTKDPENLKEILAEFIKSIHPTDSIIKRSAKVPDPPVYTGNKKEFFSWMSSILLKLNVNEDHFPSDQIKMAYIHIYIYIQDWTHLVKHISIAG
ncbi:hypothetical protein EV44_g3472 [Erysiphe necator]|uniref:Uncharacterized protein n=1 Tax=Uncinula necator TaxID=52586 RepID=A0A0B1PEE3_UNCNE|nr:hypothetical protein EV44_g3472 [Erysiphe necator]